jgi:hypothetical protein
MMIDNPTATDYFIVIDTDTLALPAYTFIEDYEAKCGEGQRSGNFGQDPVKHRYCLLDANRKLLFDTSFVPPQHYVVINPTRSRYVEWTVIYGDDYTDEEPTTITIDSVEYEGEFRVYNSFVFETKAGGSIDCNRNIPGSIDVTSEKNNYRFFFFREQDFVVAYNGYSGASPKEEAEVDMYNLMTDLYNEAVDNRQEPKLITDNTLKILREEINSEHYKTAMSTINGNKQCFEVLNPQKFARLNAAYEIYQQTEESEETVLPFTQLHIVNYGFNSDRKPFVKYSAEYNTETGKCVTDYHIGEEH